MTPQTSWRIVAAVLSGLVAVPLYELLMVVAGQEIRPVSCLIAAAVGAGIGWLRTGQLLARDRARATPVPAPAPAPAPQKGRRA